MVRYLALTVYTSTVLVCGWEAGWDQVRWSRRQVAGRREVSGRASKTRGVDEGDISELRSARRSKIGGRIGGRAGRSRNGVSGMQQCREDLAESSAAVAGLFRLFVVRFAFRTPQLRPGKRLAQSPIQTHSDATVARTRSIHTVRPSPPGRAVRGSPPHMAMCHHLCAHSAFALTNLS